MSHEAPLPDAARIGKSVTTRRVLDELRAAVATLMPFRTGIFPGSQPVSFEKRHLDLVKSQPYTVCEKTDGTRYLMVIVKGAPYLVDRRFDFFNVMVFLPRHPLRPEEPRDVPLWHDRTILDGELVLDTVNGKKELVYLIYDAVTVNGVSVMELPLTTRLQVVRDHILSPRARLRAAPQFAQRMQTEPFRIALKNMFDVASLPHVLTKVIPVLPHENDGLIFTPVHSPYTLGTDQRLLKWKPFSLNTVDFELQILSRGSPPTRMVQLLAADKGTRTTFSWIQLPKEVMDAHPGRELSGKIAECSFDPSGRTYVPPAAGHSWDGGSWERGCWRWLRFREDKAGPNEISTVKRILLSQRDNVTAMELLDALVPGSGVDVAALPPALQ